MRSYGTTACWWLECVPVFVLAGILGFAGVAKLFSAPGIIDGIIATVETASAVALLMMRALGLVSKAAVVLGVLGIIIAMTTDVPCGCLGRQIELDRSGHLMLASATGALGYWVYMNVRRKRQPEKSS